MNSRMREVEMLINLQPKKKPRISMFSFELTDY